MSSRMTMKNTRAMRSPRAERTSHSPPPSESTKGLPTGQTHWTTRMSAPIVFFSSLDSARSHSRTGSCPASEAEEHNAQGTRGRRGHGGNVSKKILSSSEKVTSAQRDRRASRRMRRPASPPSGPPLPCKSPDQPSPSKSGPWRKRSMASSRVHGLDSEMDLTGTMTRWQSHRRPNMTCESARTCPIHGRNSAIHLNAPGSRRMPETRLGSGVSISR